jgi:hypothetical protein
LITLVGRVVVSNTSPAMTNGVSNTSNRGINSLRPAIIDANNHPGAGMDGADVVGVSGWGKAFAKAKPVKLKGKVAKGIGVSGKFILFVMDAANEVPEGDESNNAAAAGPIP